MGSEGGPVATLQDYLRVLRRRKWIIIVAVVLAPLVAVLLAQAQRTLYTASARVLVSRQDLSANLLGISDPTQLDSPRLLTTQAQFARLPVIALAALQAAGVKNGSASDLLGPSTVVASDNSDFLTFTVSDAHLARAVRLTAAYANAYVAYRRQYDAAQFASAAKSVQAQIHTVKATGSDRPLYASLVDRANQLTAMEALAASEGALVSPAGAGPVPPPVARDGIIALVLGLVTGVGLAFLRDALDPRVRSAEEIGNGLRLRLLARLPRPPRALRSADRLVMLADPESPYAEPFRMLRTSVEFVTARGPRDRRRASLPMRAAAPLCYRVMVTSAVEGEGKSTTVANLAVAFARAGRKVLLVDLDFRRASLHRFFGLDGRWGLSDVVLGSAPVVAAYSEVAISGGEPKGRNSDGLPLGTLRVVPFGTVPLHAEDGSFIGGIEGVLGELEKDADLVLIDSPPLLRVGDALALTSYVNGLLVVASLRSLRAPMLKELRRVLDDTPVAKLGFILTDADLEGGYEYLAYRYPHRARIAG